MGIKFHCPNGHRLNVKSFLAGKRGVCPHCSTPVDIPLESDPAAEKRSGKNHSSTQPAAHVGAGHTGGGVATMDASVATANAPASSALHSGPLHAGVAVAPGPATQPITASAATGSLPTGGNGYATAAAPQAVAAVPTGAPVPTVAPTVPQIGTAAAVQRPDPIAEAPEAVWYVRPPSGGQYGPARGDVMHQWLQEERVTADSLIWREGWADWQTASAAFPQLGAKPATGSAVAVGQPAGGVIGGVAAPSSTERAASRRPRRKSKSLAVATVVTLGLVCVALIVALVFVVRGTL